MFGLGELRYPLNMLNAYKDIRFEVAGSQVSISINKYRNNSYPKDKGGTDDARAIKDALQSLNMKEIHGRAGGTWKFQNMYTGKGSIDEIITGMTILVDYSGKFIDKYRTRKDIVGKVAGWMADDSLSWQDCLQRIADTTLGLDCNGFVGNWIAWYDHSRKISSQSPIEHIYNSRSKKRRNVADIQGTDLLVWEDFSHITVVDWEADKGKPHFMICQSAGGGPRINEYRLYPTNKGTFYATGGYPQGDRAGTFHAISLW